MIKQQPHLHVYCLHWKGRQYTHINLHTLLRKVRNVYRFFGLYGVSATVLPTPTIITPGENYITRGIKALV